MKPFVMIIAGLMLGPALAKAKAPPPPLADPQCLKVANFGKSIETIKEAGVTQQDFQSYISTPTVQTFPINAIKSYVFNLNAPSPDAVYDTMMEKCAFLGYDKVLDFFKQNEELLRLRVENADLKQQVAELNNKLVLATNPVRYSTGRHSSEPTKPVPVYGTPIGQ